MILIVDDEKIIRLVLREKLRSQGHVCLEAGEGTEAMKALRENPIDLVILDIKMPGRSGIELLPEIKAGYPDTAVIMVTAVGDIDTAILAMKLGAYDFLTKPFNLEEVVLSVNRAMEKRRLELENRDYQQHLEQKVQQQAEKIRSSFLNAITALAYAMEAKDKYTSGHSYRVAEMSLAIAKELGMDRSRIEKVRFAGVIHDIGKIGVKESILNKPAPLSATEFDIVKSHPQTGAHILAPVVEDEEILKVVKHHHERYDGRGYPDGLPGEDIPLGARIVAVADAYDAMTSDRPYRAPLPVERTLDEIRQAAGSQFDPRVVQAFLRVREALPAETASA